MGDAGRGDDASRLTGALRHRGEAQDLPPLRAGAVPDLDLAVHADDVVARLHSGHHRDGGRCRIGHLGIVRVGLGQGRMGQPLHAQDIRLAVDAAFLPLVNAAGRDGRDAHAVANEQDHVLRPVGVRRHAQAFLERRLGGTEIGIVELRQGVLSVRTGTGGGQQGRNADETSHVFVPPMPPSTGHPDVGAWM
jgi:hypothetical protein